MIKLANVTQEVQEIKRKIEEINRNFIALITRYNMDSQDIRTLLRDIEKNTRKEEDE